MAFLLFPVSRGIGCSLKFELWDASDKENKTNYLCSSLLCMRKKKRKNGKAMKPINLTKKEHGLWQLPGKWKKENEKNAKRSFMLNRVFHLFTALNPLQQFFFLRRFSKRRSKHKSSQVKSFILADLIIFALILAIKRSLRFVCSRCFRSDKEDCKRTVTARQ